MLETVGIAAILKDELREEVLGLWDLIDKKYSSKGVGSFDYPNLSFQGGKCERIPSLKKELDKLSKCLPAFEIIIDGFGYFEEPSKCIYLHVIKTVELERIHKAINDTLEKYCYKVFDYYKPEKWMPHISLAMNDLTDENYFKFKQDMSDQHPYCKQIINEIHLIGTNMSQSLEVIGSWSCEGN